MIDDSVRGSSSRVGRGMRSSRSRYISQPFSCVPEKQNKSPSSSADARNEPMMMTESEETKKKWRAKGGKGGVSVVWPRRRESRYIYHLTPTRSLSADPPPPQRSTGGNREGKGEGAGSSSSSRRDTRARARERDNAAKGRGRGRALPKKEG